MKSTVFFLSLLAGILVVATGCNESGSSPYGSGHDFGVNDPEVYLCFGDSLTAGFGGVTPYPSNLATFLGRTVINRGIPGERVGAGLARLGEVLDTYKPGYCLIMEGVNDIIHNESPEYIAETLRSMIRVAKSRNVLPVISTLTPFVGEREGYNGELDIANVLIRAVASEEGVLLVDNAEVIRGRPEYVLEDGLHYTESGSIAIAASWSDRL